MEHEPSAFIGLLYLAVIVLFYFLPSFVARAQRHRNSVAIFALNLLLGWTLLGWVAALVWALVDQRKEVVRN